MDKLRDFMRTLKRIHFWILCGIIAILGPVIWVMARGSLEQQTAANKAAIDSAVAKVRALEGEMIHPNDEVKKKMDEVIESRLDEIRAAWQQMYDQQKDVFTWPSIANNSIRAALEQLLPIERNVEFPIPPELADRLSGNFSLNKQQAYKYYVMNELQRMAKDIGSEWVATTSEIDTTRPGTKDNRDVMVRWDAASQQEILKKHFTWGTSGTSSSEGLPNTLDALYAQEDLWVLDALMGIIKRTNAGAFNAHNANVREIVSIKIGQDAVRNEAVLVEHTRSDTGDSTDDTADSSFTDTPAATDLSLGNDPAEGRYVDKNYEPLSAQKLREVMTGASLQPEDAYLAVAKRVPIRMTVKIDQRALDRLLVECANSHPTVEIRQVRMPDDSQETSRTGLSLTNTRTAGSETQEESPFPFDVRLEVYGIVYIYNPVPTKEAAKAVFGIGEEDGGGGGDEVTDDFSYDAATKPADDSLASLMQEGGLR